MMYDIVWSSIKYLATTVSHANSHCGQKTNILLWYSQKYVAWNLIVLSSIYLHACLPVQHLINEQRTCNKRKHNKYTEYKTKWLRNTTYTNRRHSHTHTRISKKKTHVVCLVVRVVRGSKMKSSASVAAAARPRDKSAGCANRIEPKIIQALLTNTHNTHARKCVVCTRWWKCENIFRSAHDAHRNSLFGSRAASKSVNCKQKTSSQD